MPYSPFTYLPPGLCDDMPLPVMPFDQECTSYPQKTAEVCGLIIVPGPETAPESWQDFDEWSFLNNNYTSPHYIVGIGSFLPTEKDLMSLAGGRVEENRGYRYRLAFSVTNMADGHVDFARSLMANKKDFTFFLHTIGDRVIGGPDGMLPVYVGADVPFGSEGATEQVAIIIDTEFFAFPEW